MKYIYFILACALLATINLSLAGKSPPPVPTNLTAEDLTLTQCTANDTFIVGAGVIQGCPGPNECLTTNDTFSADVLFLIQNNAGSDRPCFVIYLCGDGRSEPVTLLGKNNSFSGLQNQTIHFDNLPCSILKSGEECFGALPPSEIQGGVFDKGACPKDAAGNTPCCDTISWSTPGGVCEPNVAIQTKSHCRHQQVCIQSKRVDVQCTSNCNKCGEHTEIIRVCEGGIESPNFVLTSVPNVPISAPVVTPPVGDFEACRNFSATVNGETNFTGRVTSGTNANCVIVGTFTSETPQNPTVVIAVNGSATTCDGNVTLSGSNASACDNPAFEWFVDDVKQVGETSANFTFSPNQLNKCSEVKVQLTCGNGCSANTTKPVNVGCINVNFPETCPP